MRGPFSRAAIGRVRVVKAPFLEIPAYLRRPRTPVLPAPLPKVAEVPADTAVMRAPSVAPSGASH